MEPPASPLARVASAMAIGTLPSPRMKARSISACTLAPYGTKRPPRRTLHSAAPPSKPSARERARATAARSSEAVAAEAVEDGGGGGASGGIAERFASVGGPCGSIVTASSSSSSISITSAMLRFLPAEEEDAWADEEA